VRIRLENGQVRTRRFANDAEYAAYWGERATFVEPGSPEYRWLIRDLDDYFRSRNHGFGRSGSRRTASGSRPIRTPIEALEPHPVDLEAPAPDVVTGSDVGTYGRTGMEFHLYTPVEVAFGMRTNFDPVTRLPRSVEYTQVGQEGGPLPSRPSQFRLDPMVSREQQLRHRQYTGTEFERGHLMPREAAATYPDVLSGVDVMTNIAPQFGRGSRGVNQGIWRSYEMLAQRQAAEHGWIRVRIDVVRAEGGGTVGGLPEIVGFTRRHYDPSGNLILGVSVLNR
jgi:hypothetical protein